MTRSIYIETSVVSYLTSRGSRDLVISAHQEETRELWPRLLTEFESFVSALVYEEAKAGNKEAAKRRLEAIESLPFLQTSNQAEQLADSLVKEGAIPEKCPEDAMHIALAAINGIDVIVTWNFSHINNPFKRAHIRKIIERSGYLCPEICSPGDLLEVE
jgi:predicted nucleic acid-binding protein